MLTVVQACRGLYAVSVFSAAVLATTSLFPQAAVAQPEEIDWRTATILRFEPTRGSDGSYLKSVADALESEWIGETGITAVAIGAIFATEAMVAQAAPGPDAPAAVFAFDNIDPSLGSADDFARIAAAALRANLPIILHLQASNAPETYARLAEWATGSGTRHFILQGADEEDVRALRGALQASGIEGGWIAGAAPHAEGSFDATVEPLAAADISDDAALSDLYSRAAQRSAAARKPAITSVSLSSEASAERQARLLLHPGPLEVVVEHAYAGASSVWQRIAAFRARHPASVRGEHVHLANNTFAFGRISTDPLVDDRIVVVLGASNATTVNVSRIFPDNTLLSDALTGSTAFVSFGMASFDVGPEGIILIEEVR